MKLDVREAICLLREREREVEEFAKMAKEADRKRTRLGARVDDGANSRKLERENARLRTAATEMEERMEQIVSMNERSGRSISEIVRSSPVKRYLYRRSTRNRRERRKKRGRRTRRRNGNTDCDDDDVNIKHRCRHENQRRPTPISILVLVSRRNRGRYQHHATLPSSTKRLSLRQEKEVDTAPPYATSADLLASNLLVVTQHEKNITPPFLRTRSAPPTFSHEILQRVPVNL